MKRLPFRKRLTVWSTIVAAVALIVSGAITAFVVHRRELSLVDESLRVDSAHFFSEIHHHGGVKFDWKTIEFELREWIPQMDPPRPMEIRTGSVVRWRSPNLSAPGFTNHPAGFSDVQLGDTDTRVLVQENGGITFAIGSDLRAPRSLTGALAGAMFASLPVALAFAWFGGRRLATAAVAPLDEMTEAAERITADHIDQRLPVPVTNDEVQRHAVVLNRTFDRLERSYQQALRFSADASHELKSPLTVMRVSIEAMLHSPSLDENDRQTASGLLEQTRRLSNIISSLLLLARADAGRLKLDFEEHDLAAITEACVEDARIMAEERGIRVECTLPETAIARVDTLRFSQIASNLLDNAVKYNRTDGEIRVELSEGDDACRLSVANTGPEIPQEMRPRLFERFFRAEHTSEQSGSGLGLGLARELARAHGGDVELVRSEDGWNEFVLRLPKSNLPQPQTVLKGESVRHASAV